MAFRYLTLSLVEAKYRWNPFNVIQVSSRTGRNLCSCNILLQIINLVNSHVVVMNLRMILKNSHVVVVKEDVTLLGPGF